jgi:hypothetical protein
MTNPTPVRAWLAAMSLLLAGAAPAQVGLRTATLGDLPVTLVYPTDAAAVATTFGPFTLEVAPDAEPRAGRYRLVVISHGTGGSCPGRPQRWPGHAGARRASSSRSRCTSGDNFQ